MSCLAARATAAIVKATTPNVINRVHASNYIIAARPRVRISFTEKVLHGCALVVGMYTIPIYILLHIKEYRE